MPLLSMSKTLPLTPLTASSVPLIAAPFGTEVRSSTSFGRFAAVAFNARRKLVISHCAGSISRTLTSGSTLNFA